MAVSSVPAEVPLGLYKLDLLTGKKWRFIVCERWFQCLIQFVLLLVPSEQVPLSKQPIRTKWQKVLAAPKGCTQFNPDQTFSLHVSVQLTRVSF